MRERPSQQTRRQLKPGIPIAEASPQVQVNERALHHAQALLINDTQSYLAHARE